MNNKRNLILTLVVILLVVLVAWLAVEKSRKASNAPVNNSGANAAAVDAGSETSCGEIRNPSDGSTVTSGSEVAVEVDFKGKTWDTVELLGDSGLTVTIDPTTGKGVLTVPQKASGPMELNLIGIKDEAELCSGQTIALLARPSAKITKLYVIPQKIYFSPSDTKKLLVSATYDDGVDRSARSSVVGTVYVSADPSIARVNEEGLVTALRPGTTTINVTNGTQFKNITVRVLEKSELP